MQNLSKIYLVLLEKTLILFCVPFVVTASIFDIILSPWNQVMLIVKFANCRTGDFIEEDV